MLASSRSDALRLLEALVGLPCGSALGGSGGALSLDLGPLRPRPVRLSNPRLSFVERRLEGTHALLLECPWRLDGPAGVLTSSVDAPSPQGALEAGLAELLDRRLERVELGEVGPDLALAFEGGLRLGALAVRAHPRAEGVDWTLSCPEGRLEARPGGRLVLLPLRAVPAAPDDDEDVVAAWRARWAAAGRGERPGPGEGADPRAT